MDSFGDVSATTWTAIDALVGIAGLIATILIAVILRSAERRSAASAQRVNDVMAELTRRSRLDEVRRQLRDEDSTYLRLLIDEGRRLAGRSRAERFAVEKAYFTNPASPLLTSSSMIPDDLGAVMRRDILTSVIRELPNRYPSKDASAVSWLPEFAGLTRLAIEWKAPVHEIGAFIAAKAADGWTIGDPTIRSILFPEPGYACPPNLEAASDFLYALRHARVTRANMVNIVAGVSLAVCDFSRAARLASVGHVFMAYVVMMQHELDDIGKWDDETGMTIAVDHAVAAMVHAVGLTAGGDEHMNMRAVEALTPILAGFSDDRFTEFGIVADHMSAGVSALLATNAPIGLRERLREETLRLLPTIRTRLEG